MKPWYLYAINAITNGFIQMNLWVKRKKKNENEEEHVGKKIVGKIRISGSKLTTDDHLLIEIIWH